MLHTSSSALLAATAAATLLACGTGGAAKRLPGNLGPVTGKQISFSFEVAVSNLDTTPVFSWPGGQATSIIIARANSEEAVWGAEADDGGGFASPVTLNVLPAGATAKMAAHGGMIGGQSYDVIIIRADGGNGSQRFRVPNSVGLGGMCTETSEATAHHGHCVFPLAGKGNLCTHYTGSAGENVAESKHFCEVRLKGTYGEGACPDSTAGQCLSRCGAPNESLDTVYFATPEEWKGACDARKGTFQAP